LHQLEKIQAIGQLTGGIAHGFNNQLVRVMNFAELAKNEVDENSAATLYISNIVSGALRSAGLTKKLLAFARNGKYVITTIDIKKTISEVVSVLVPVLTKTSE